jgi:putative SOS response-associated peptidase YedK
MCSQYGLQLSFEELRDQGIEVNGDHKIDQRFLPYTQVPVIVASREKLKLTPMNFSLVPHWSKEPKVKFATHNARIETVTEKPAWREPFKAKHCVIPMTRFYESVYEGPLAGNIIEFSKPDNVLYAAGIFDVWIEPETKKQIFSCAILTTVPSEFISQNGHDRSPIFLNFSDVKIWLTLQESEKSMVDFLLQKNLSRLTSSSGSTT